MVALDLSVPCRVYVGYIDPAGYGRRGTVLIHRAAYAEFYGPIPKGLAVGHACHDADLTCSGGLTCPHRACYEPRHLVLQTIAENVASGVPGRVRTHCAHGHEYVPENIYTRPGGSRECRICKRDQMRRFYERHPVSA